MRKNIFVPALEEGQRAELQTIRNARQYAFYGLLDVPTLIEPERIDFNEVLDKARHELQLFKGPIDAMIAHWDFPTSVLTPILCHEYSLPSPSLESVLKCEHKYWSRVEQAKCIPDCMPKFSLFDPFSDNPREQVELDYPFWIKPVKSFASQLGFLVENDADFSAALKRTCAKIHYIGDAFDQVLEHVELPAEIRQAKGNTCIAEELIQGDQAAPEGSMFQGEFNVHGVFDMHKDPNGKSFSRLQYPSSFPQEVQQRMIDASEIFLRHIGFDNGCFNTEFMWDREKDKLRLIEVNTRISQSHSEMFIQVDGMSNHEVAIDVALGRKPVMPRRKGPYKLAAKFIIPYYEDGIVTRSPTPEELDALRKRFPHIDIRLEVEPGIQLSALPNQDSYCFQLGVIYLGADSEEELLERYQQCLDALSFGIEPVRRLAIES